MNWRELPLIRKANQPHCMHMVCWSMPFGVFFSTPFVIIFSYFNSQDRKPLKQWNVKLLGRDFLIGWSIFVTYAALRTFFLDPYCDPNSVHNNPNLNAFDRKKQAIASMKEILREEGKLDKE
jgi:hypothetical protein